MHTTCLVSADDARNDETTPTLPIKDARVNRLREFFGVRSTMLVFKSAPPFSIGILNLKWNHVGRAR